MAATTHMAALRAIREPLATVDSGTPPKRLKKKSNTYGCQKSVETTKATAAAHRAHDCVKESGENLMVTMAALRAAKAFWWEPTGRHAQQEKLSGETMIASALPGRDIRWPWPPHRQPRHSL
jgi:hypothetical protein